MTSEPSHYAQHGTPITIDAWQVKLRRWVLRTGVQRVAKLAGVTRGAVYAWIRRDDPRLPGVDMCKRLDDLMGPPPGS